MKLASKVAIVTGAGSGLGREIALEYAREGACVGVLSIIQVQVASVVEECKAFGGAAIGACADVTLEVDVRDFVEKTVRRFGRLDILVNAAGIDLTDLDFESRLIQNLSLEAWRSVFRVNVEGTFLCTREAVPHMIRTDGGSIINFSSGTVRFPIQAYGPYTSSKFAIEGFTKVAAQELEKHNIRVNCLQPGGVTDTAIVPEWMKLEHPSQLHEPAVIRACAAYLASDESAFVTGRSLVATEWNKERNIVLCPCPTCRTRTPRLALEWRGATAL